MNSKPCFKERADDIVKVIDDVPATGEKDPAIGIVTGCLKLNLRAKPDINADVLTTLDALTPVVVDTDGSAEKFWKVCIASGLEGYCAKEFIAIRREKECIPVN